MSLTSRSLDREFDIVLYGATGFTGQLVAAYLARHAPGDLRIALAGRSAGKLAAVHEAIPGTEHWELLTADSGNESSVSTMAAMTRVLISTVGPYLRHGLPLVRACAEAGTHYVDLTGETLFIRRSIDAYDALARRSGARIVHSCGFDSVPSDLGVLALHLAASRDGGGALGATKMAVVSASGGVSGGTIGSAMNQFAETAANPALARIVSDPYALSPDRTAEPTPGDGGDSRLASFDPDFNTWVSPFVMSLINTRVVRRSNALLGYAYSKDFRYQEMMSHGAGPAGLLRAVAVASGTALGQAALSFGPTRAAAERVVPKPGDGPSEETMRNGHFAIRLLTRTPDGARYRGLVAAQGDPGYAATSMMLSECALALAVDEARLPDLAGVLTPASGLGEATMHRLIAAGMTFTAYRD